VRERNQRLAFGGTSFRKPTRVLVGMKKEARTKETAILPAMSDLATGPTDCRIPLTVHRGAPSSGAAEHEAPCILEAAE